MFKNAQKHNNFKLLTDYHVISIYPFSDSCIFCIFPDKATMDLYKSRVDEIPLPHAVIVTYLEEFIQRMGDSNVSTNFGFCKCMKQELEFYDVEMLFLDNPYCCVAKFPDMNSVYQNGGDLIDSVANYTRQRIIPVCNLESCNFQEMKLLFSHKDVQVLRKLIDKHHVYQICYNAGYLFLIFYRPEIAMEYGDKAIDAFTKCFPDYTWTASYVGEARGEFVFDGCEWRYGTHEPFYLKIPNFISEEDLTDYTHRTEDLTIFNTAKDRDKYHMSAFASPTYPSTCITERCLIGMEYTYDDGTIATL